MIDITDEDIEKVEQKFDLKFDDESKEFIKCIESKDIQACPGAGKTTSLVAKLDILANYMPFNDNSGILVLTHTNVAVDEIKKKLDTNAKVILGYPNHVGTFQSFINKFLAIPMYVKIYGKKPERIDSNIFELKLLRKLKSYYLDIFIVRSAEANNFSNLENFLTSLEVEETKIVLKQVNGRKKTIVNKGKPSYRNLKKALNSKIINEVIIDGYLTYSHCYALALKYLTDYPYISKIFQKRFKYVFVDEAQDTDDKQFDILNKLFEKSDVVVQKIGDNNQAIYNIGSSNKSSFWDIEPKSIEIKSTKRLSSLISEQVEKIAISKQKLNGDDNITIKPTIILFDESCIEEVIPRFAELIIEQNLHHLDSPIFKAIGGVAKINDKGHTLPSYFSDYKKDDNCFSLYNTLQEKLKNCFENKLQLSEYRNIVLDIIKEYLKDENIYYIDKPYTKRTILKYVKEHNEQSYSDFKLKLFNIVDKLAKYECIIDELKSILSIILDANSVTLNDSKLESIIKGYKYNKKIELSSNVYKHNQENIEVQISTIHRVKGETHTATLILETFNRGYDITQLLGLLQNKRKQGLEAKKKLLYVAMSRPTHLLCLAIHNNLTYENIELLESNGFEIINLSEER